ncbi:MAG TPA: SH3 domain-containing protein [Kofleriaceae bacterium]|nr:SH3 domain-containing protein [Kofleriaceae bacterium]
MAGGFDAKPGGGSLVQNGQAGGALAAPGKRTLTEQVNGPAAQAPARVRVTARGLNVRKEPTTDANIVGGLRRGDTVDVIDRDGKWLVVVHGGANAFIHGDYVEPAEATPPAAHPDGAAAPKPQVAADTADRATPPPKTAPPTGVADEQPWWFDDETRAKPVEASASASASTSGGSGAQQVLAAVVGAAEGLYEAVVAPFVGSGGDADGKRQPTTPTTTTTTTPTPDPTPTTTKTPATTTSKTSPVPSLTPGDLHDESLEQMVTALNLPQVTSIAGDLAGLKAKSRELQEKASRKEERGKGRDDLVASIGAVRTKLAALDGAGADPKQVTAFKAAVYRALNDIAPYYFQSRNIDILETPPADKTRTCNITCLGMALESLGRSPASFTGDRAAVLAAARVYQHKVVGDDVSDGAVDATAGTGTSWDKLAGMRFPDFLELAAIAHEMKGPPTDENVKAGAKLAWDAILKWDNLKQLGRQFGASVQIKMFDATGIKTDRKQKTVSDEKVIDQHGDKNRMPVEAYINARNKADASGKETDRAKLEKLRPAYEQAIAGEGIEDRLSLDAYKQHVIDHIGADLNAGAAVIVGLAGHFVRLQAIHEDHVVVDDPARDTRSGTKLTFAEARAMGYFHMRFVLS